MARNYRWDKEQFMQMVTNAPNKRLQWMLEQIEHELSLSETAIKEGFEKRR